MQKQYDVNTEYENLLKYNPNYMDDLKFAFKINRWLLYWTASWPLSNSKVFKRLKTLLNFVHIVFIIGFILGYVFDLIINPLTFGEYISEGGMLMVFVGYFLKYIITTIHSSKIHLCYVQIKDDWKYIWTGSYETMRKSAQSGRRITISYIVVIMITFVLWNIVPLTKKAEVVDGEIYHHLPFVSEYIFFNARKNPFYPYVFVYQVYTALVMLGTICHNCAAAVFAMHGCAQYEILLMILKDISNGMKSDVELKTKLVYVIKKHNQLARYSHWYYSG